MKGAIKSKGSVALETLRDIKSALLVQTTSADKTELTLEDEIKLLQKLQK